MKLSKLLTFILILYSGSLYSQDGWFWQNPLPQGNQLISVSYVNSSLVYVSGYSGTLMKSTNGGLSFTIVPTGLRDGIGVIFINELTGFSGASGGLLKTTDGGYTWQYIPAPVSGVSQIVAGTPMIFYTLSDNKIYKSTDMCNTWVVSLIPTVNTQVNGLHFVNSQTGYAVGKKLGFTYSKIYRTTSGGISWDSIVSNIRKELLGVEFTDVNTGYVTCQFGSLKILKTTNGCLNWDTVFSPVSGNPFRAIKFFNNSEGYAGSYNVIARTTNAGSNWEEIYTGKNTNLVNINEGLGLDNNFIFRTSNSGMNWTQISTGFKGDLLDVVFLNNSTGFTIDYDRILKTTNSGINWTAYYLGIQEWSPYLENIMFVNDNTGYAGIDGGKVAKTTNCGVNWSVYKTNCFDHLHGMSFPSADTGYAVTKYGFYLKTTNGGVNWITLERIQEHAFGDVYFINNNTGFAAGNSGDVGIIRRTTNGGVNWTLLMFDSIVYFTDAFASDPNTWFASGNYQNGSSVNGVIARSTNAGLTWAETRFPMFINSIHFPTPTVGYASSYYGVMYKTTNRGESWEPTECINYNSSFGIFFINENTGWAVGYDGQIIKTTTGGGNPIGIEPVSSAIPESFMLHQNYPNPFNPATRIRFSIPVTQNPVSVSLIIYDILGREVKTLLNQNLTAGEYSVDFDASLLPSGVYFYQLRSGDFTESRKMILLK
jgi:photosystem II stability/assembly factor-like uncharacterized protein